MTARILPVVVLLAGCADAAPRAAQPPPPAEFVPARSALDAAYRNRQRFGMNLSGVIDWSREWAFVDVFKPSRPWIKHGPGEFAFDARGNPLLQPGQSVETLCCREIQGHYPAGVYTAVYAGTGSVDLSRFDVRKVLRRAPGRIEIDAQPGDGGLQVRVTASDPKDPIRDLHVWMPGFEKAKSPFHPLFVQRLEPFGVLRFMDWQQTNNSPLRTWDQRAQPEDARYSTDAGVPLEVMLELANTCKAHPWFCIPHQADDEFVRRFARLVRDQLDPGLKVYVEYSNEVWNWQFAQARYAAEQGRKLNLGDPEHLRFYSQRAVEIFTIWEQVFGRTKRVVRVLGTQYVNTYASEQILKWRNAHQHADALAVGAYFGHRFGDPKTADEVSRMTAGQLLDALEKEVTGPDREHIRKQAALARKYGLELIAYEGGQHLAGFGGAENNAALTALLIAANRHERMGSLYRKHLAHWFAEGGGLYAVFSNVAGPSKWGSWGVLEYQDQPTHQAPKYQAIVDTIRGELPSK